MHTLHETASSTSRDIFGCSSLTETEKMEMKSLTYLHERHKTLGKPDSISADGLDDHQKQTTE